MIGIDTCFLIDLYWQDSPRNKKASALYSKLANDDSSFKRTLAWMNMHKLDRKRINDTQMAACYLTQGVSKIITATPKDFELFECFEVEDYK